MAVKILLRVGKCDLKASALPSLCRFFARNYADRGTQQQTPKFQVSFGADFRAPQGKDVYEDAYFVWDKHGVAAFGVADGVSSWRNSGIDASLFPNTLLANCINHLEQSQGKMDPQECLDLANQEILQNNQVEAGSSTVCLGILDKETGLLRTANLGDSGFCIFRNDQTFFKSKEQYQDWNVPYQLGVKEIMDGKPIPHGNSLSDAAIRHFYLEDNDLLVWGTDGLFDNLFPEDIFDMMKPHSPGETIDWNTLARQLTKTAVTRSVELRPDRITPREQRMQEYKEDSLEIPGGNFDDVTVIVIHVKAHPDV